MTGNVYALTLSQQQKHQQLMDEAATFRLVAALRQGRRSRPSLIATMLTAILWGFGKVS